MDRHDAFYHDQREIEDLMFKLSMEDTVRIHKGDVTSREGSPAITNDGDSVKDIQSIHEPHFSSDCESISGSTPFSPEESYSVIYESQSMDRSHLMRIQPQGWQCPECEYSNIYVSDNCVSCYTPTPKYIV